MINVDRSYATQVTSVEVVCKIYAYFKRKAFEESQLVMNALHSSLREAFKDEDGPSTIYQDADFRRSILNRVNADNPNLYSFKVTEGE